MMESQIYKGVDTCYLPLDKFKIAIRIGQWTLARFSVETNSDCGRLDTCYLPLATLSIGKCQVASVHSNSDRPQAPYTVPAWD